ncbi:dermonecrotic toxin domain-containing protein [Pseudomonas thivervalensis]|uniref:dermonecrotic toxin domain-containing protein n=1 Tax=Pseudomonas thivervalensis TaxID=86265 RepID=UPI003D653602
MTALPTADTAAALAQRVSLQFASRPTFEQVAQRMLAQALKEKYPWLTLDLAKTQLATPDVVGRGWHFQSFMAWVLDYLALGTPLDLSPQGNLDYYLSDSVPRRLWSGNEKPDMNVIKKVLLELAWSVPIGLQDALTRYWNTDLDASGQTGTKITRWGWLSDVLRNTLNIRGLQQPGLSDPARAALDQIVRWPDRDRRFNRHNQAPVYAYSLETRITRGTSSTVLAGTEILLTWSTRGATEFLLCGPGGPVQSFASVEAFNEYWGERIASRYIVDAVTCQRYEISGNVFEIQAAMLLEQQLADLKAVQLPARIGLQTLKKLYNDLSDPARYLLDAPRPTPKTSTQLEPLLPKWLQTASIADQTAFQRYSLTLASAKKRNQGQTFLSDISDIRAFTANALLNRMTQTNDSRPDKVPASHFQPDDVQLTFTVSAGYPGAVGISEERNMSLTDLAINNLVARPSGDLKLSHRLGQTLPAWITPDFITRKGGLIEQVDIGTNYPGYLREKLLGSSPQAQRRQQLFAQQIPAQLALEALKQLLDNENGMTRKGLRLVEAVLQPDADAQQVDARPVVMRHLAFLRKPQAQPDVVTNQFIIEAQDITTGPHLLYRPLYAPALQEFATREALLQAITAAGDLQDSVLTWLSDAARPVYTNGGFLEPRIVRFFPGDEFEKPEKPAPAALATVDGHDELLQALHNGELMQYLYGCNAQALVTQADRGSVSNSESRWAVLLEGGGLLFNTLLFPLLRGPAMTTVWLWNLMASANHDIPALISEDPVARELAAVDLLVNLALLVSQFPSGRAPARAPVPESVKKDAMRPPAPWTVAEQWPAPASPSIVEGAVGLPGAYAEAPSRTLDLSFANPLQRLTPKQRTRLLRLQVPHPASLPEPITNGPYKGLYVIGNKWHAEVDGVLYRATPEEDGSATIVDPLDPTKKGPPLRVDSQGHWSLDLGLRLLGGAPPKRVAAQRRLNTQRTNELSEEMDQFIAQEPDRHKALTVALQVLARLEEGPYTEAQRAPKRKVFYDLLQAQTERYVRLVNSAPERASLGIAFTPKYLRGLLEVVVRNARRASLITERDYTNIRASHPQYAEPNIEEAMTHDLPGYKRFLDTLTDVTDQWIHWLELKDDYLERLLNLDEAGAQAFERLTTEFSPGGIDATGTNSLQLSTLPILAIKNTESDLIDSLFHIVEPLGEQMIAHCELRRYELLPSEQLEVLESLTERYGQSLDALQGIKTLYADDIDEAYFDRFIKVVESLYQDVSGKLAVEIKPEPKPRRRAPRRPKAAPGRPQKQVIRTRKSGVLIGDLKPAGTALPIEVVELRSETGDRVIATYSRHDDIWDVVDVRHPVPAPTPRTRTVKAIKRDARKLLDQLAERLRRAESYRKYCRYPQEIEEIVNNEASRFSALHAELDRAFSAAQTSPTPADQALREQLSDAVSSLTSKGRALRIELSLQLPPTDSNLRFLFEKELIQVARLGERQALKGERKDFLQEYAINDRDGFPIWYAHFHYEKADTPKADYSVAHLKTKEQRREHYHSLLAKADSPYAVVNVHRGQLSKSLAQSKFLPLAP